ncbi:MAG: vitamin B12 dependent-methionine synthase activation domain-containing protein [Candidatus Heimdallarchaeaceae archaeon]
MRLIKDIDIELYEEEILRLLSSKKGNRSKKKASSILIDNIREAMKSSLELIKPKAIYDIVDSSSLNPKFLFKKSEKTILAACTIGRDLENRGSQFISRGELSKGVIMDAIASHAAEQTAEYVNKTIIEDIKDEIKGKKVTLRFSPGYCQWELGKGQEMIFNLLETDKIGVTLSESMLMTPIKSVSFAINIGEEIDDELGSRDCETCSMVNCAYRRTKKF